MSVNVTLVLFQFLSRLVPWFKGIVCACVCDTVTAHLRGLWVRVCCVCVRSTYGANELHFHFKATSQQQQKLLSSINVILGRERDSETHTERNT